MVGAMALACGDAFAASTSLSARPVALDPDRPHCAARRAACTTLAGWISGGEQSRGIWRDLSRASSVSAGGRLTAVTDRGHWFSARIVRDRMRAASWIWRTPRWGRLLDADGRPPQGEWRDAEALERLPGGDWLVSFEGNVTGSGATRRRPAACRVAPCRSRRRKGIGGRAWQRRAGGAHARSADGRILMLAESLRRTGGSRAGWLVRDGGIEPLGYRTARDFKPTDAATLRERRRARPLALLQAARRGSRRGSSGFPRSAIGGRCRAEGCAACPLRTAAHGGQLRERGGHARCGRRNPRLHPSSDDNFNFLQRTLLLLFRLEE